jgi:hypothetical protein
MELIEEVKELLIETEKVLKGSARRLFMARTVHALGERGQRLAEQELGWSRGTIRKGQRELESGIVCLDAYSLRGRKPSRRASAQLAQGYHLHRGWAESSRPAVSHESSLDAPDGIRSATPVNRALWLS